MKIERKSKGCDLEDYSLGESLKNDSFVSNLFKPAHKLGIF